MSPHTPGSKEFVCNHCQGSFRRREHLERHARCHLGLRPFKCHRCLKMFSREDTLKRHMVTHGQESPQSHNVSVAPGSSRVVQACTNCTKSKKRCDRDLPCERCRRKNLNCHLAEPPRNIERREIEGPFSEVADTRKEKMDNQALQHTMIPSTLLPVPQRSMQDLSHGNHNPFGEQATESPMCQTIQKDSQNPIMMAGGISEDNFAGNWTSLDTLPPRAMNQAPETDDLANYSFWPLSLWPFLDTSDTGSFSVSSNAPWIAESTLLNQENELGTYVCLPTPETIRDTPSRLPQSHLYGTQGDADRQNLSNHYHGNRTKTPIVSEESQHREQISNCSHLDRSQSVEQHSYSPSSLNKLLFPEVLPEDRDLIISEDSCHVPQIHTEAYQKIVAFYLQQWQLSSPPPFPRSEVINAFMQLYFEHFHPGMPFIHLPTFDPCPDRWVLLLATAAIGCQYSAIKNRVGFAEALHELLHRAIQCQLTPDTSLRKDLPFAQAILLENFSMMFGGTRESLLDLQHQRNTLITICRPLLARQSFMFSDIQTRPMVRTEESWIHWVMGESWRRVLYFAWFMECLQWILFDLPPLLSSSELYQDLPDDRFWQCSNVIEWERLRQPSAGLGNFPSIRRVFGFQKLPKDTLKRCGNAARLIIMVSLYVEERKSLQSMNSWVYQQALDETVGQQSPFSGQPSLQRIIRAADMQASFDLEYEYLLDTCESDMQGNLKKFYYLLSILRHVPLRLLYVSSGWLTVQEDLKIAEKELVDCLHADKERTRRILMHAATLFRNIRSQDFMSGHDPLFLLIATLFLWSYTRHMIRSYPRDHYTNAYLTAQPIRIDQDPNNSALQSWIKSGGAIQIHITGIGVLNRPDSSTRILKEAIRVLTRENSWRKWSLVIARALQQVLVGKSPSFEVSS